MRATFLLAILAGLFLSGCSTVSKRQAQVVSKAVYATQDALAAGRVDLAKAYSLQATRLLPPPKKREKVAPVTSKGQKYIILPVEYSGTPALAIGSPALSSLKDQDKALQRQLSAEAAALAKVEKSADKIIAQKEEIISKAEEKTLLDRHSFWGKLFFWGKVCFALAVLVAACFFFPALIPILGAIGRPIGGAISSFLSLFEK